LQGLARKAWETIRREGLARKAWETIRREGLARKAWETIRREGLARPEDIGIDKGLDLRLSLTGNVLVRGLRGSAGPKGLESTVDRAVEHRFSPSLLPTA